MRCTAKIRRPASRPRCAARTALLVVAVTATALHSTTDARVPREADRLWTYIETIEAEGHDDALLGEYERFAAEHPDDARAAEALRRMASWYVEAGRHVLALEALGRVLADHGDSPSAPSAGLELAALLREEQRWSEASETCRWILSEHPGAQEAATARLELARMQVVRGHVEDARRNLARLVAGRTQDDVASRALYELAVTDLRRGEVAIARERFEAIHERFPSSEAGARGLMESARLLGENGASTAAVERYERLLRNYGEPALRARALVAMGTLLEASDPEAAFTAFDRAIDEAGASGPLESALRGKARTGLRCVRYDEVVRAVRLHAQRFPSSDAHDSMRLHAALARLRDGDDESRETLRELGRSLDREVAHSALSALALDAEKTRRTTMAIGLWRDAERHAPDADRRAESLLGQARLTLEVGRPTLAAELALTAHDVAVDPTDRAESLLLAIRGFVAAGDRDRALATGRRILDEHPLTPQATRTREETQGIERQPLLDPREAARRLSELAEHEIMDYARRSFEVALIQRDRLGDVDAALALLRRAIDQARGPEQRGRLELEYGRTLQLRAFRQGLEGDSRAARGSWSDARDALADATVRAGTERSAHRARVLLVSMDLAERVLPDSPWVFDGWTMPVLGAVGDAESVDPRSADLDTLRVQLRDVWPHAESRDEKAWIRWRQAELARDTVEARLSMAREALGHSPSGELEWSIRSTLGQLWVAAGDLERGARELVRVVESDARGEVASSARFALALVRTRQGRYDEAQTHFDRYATVYPETERGRYALLRAGDSAFYAGRTQAARLRYGKLIEDHVRSQYLDDAMYRLGVLLERTGRPDAARDPLERLVSRSPRSTYRGRALALLGEIAAARGDLATAIAHTEEWIESDARGAVRGEAWKRIADWSLQANDPDAALLWLDRRLHHRPPDPRSLALRVRAAARLSDLHGARAVLRRLESGFRDAREEITVARLDVVEAHQGSNELEQAVDLARLARAEAPTDRLRSQAAYAEGLATARMGYGPETLRAWRTATELDPRGPWAADALYRSAGWSLEHGDVAEARNAFARFVARFPSERRVVDALRGEARCLRLLGRHAAALDRHQQILERFPDLTSTDATLLEIARCHLELEQYETAVATLRRVLPHLAADERRDAQWRMANALEALDHHLEAAEVYLVIAESDPTDSRRAAEAELAAARALESAGRSAEATALYGRLSRDRGGDDGVGSAAREALRRLEGEPARR